MAELLMDSRRAREWLDEEWTKAVQKARSDPDPEVDALVNSNVGSIRYAVVTQLLGKIADSSRSLMALQLSKGVDGAWDARSFASTVILPWERDNQQVIGRSPDPYVSKPLRRRSLDDETNVRNKSEWDALVAFLAPLEDSSREELRSAFLRVLHALVRRLARQSFAYPIPQRISQLRLESLVVAFLAEPSGGLHPLAVSAALFRTLGEAFQLFSNVQSQGINEADVASGVPGDIMCYHPSGEICLAVEVKDANLTMAHIQEASRKTKQSMDSLSNFLFAVSGTRQDDARGIQVLTYRNWSEGLDLYATTIPALVSATFILLHESWRVRFVREIGNELDERQNQPARRAWFELLSQEEYP